MKNPQFTGANGKYVSSLVSKNVHRHCWLPKHVRLQNTYCQFEGCGRVEDRLSSLQSLNSSRVHLVDVAAVQLIQLFTARGSSSSRRNLESLQIVFSELNSTNLKGYWMWSIYYCL